jgi:hypothetical protein
VDFKIVGEISKVETTATGSSIRVLSRLRKNYGKGRWRKMKGLAYIRLANGAYVSPNCIGTKPTE